jgi:hypothetical protein
MQLFHARKPIAVEIGGGIGLGALLSHACTALRIGRMNEVDVALRFTSPLYRPSWGTEDWLDAYFIRLGSDPANRPALDVAAFPYPEPEPKEPELL